MNKAFSSTGIYVKNCWISWLIDSVVREHSGGSFIEKIRQWLQAKWNDKGLASSDSRYKLMAALTGDIVFINNNFMKQYPLLRDKVIKYDFSDSFLDELGHKPTNVHLLSRRKWLKRCNTEELEKELLEFWRKNLKYFIPSPSKNYKSRYERHAQWLAIVKEFDAEFYQDIHTDWKKNHSRRINLWSALEEYGITK